MTDETLAGDGGPKHKRGGSNKRQRDCQFVVRCTRDEFNEIAGNARDAGLRGGAWLRAKGLTKGDPGPRSQHIPPVENELLIQLLGNLGRLNNNINQIARSINMGEFYELPELRQVLKDYPGIRDAIFIALGKEPSPGMKDWDDLIATSNKALEANPSAETVAIPAALLRRIVGSTAAAASVHPSPDAPAVASTKAAKRGIVRSNFLPPEGHA